MFHPTEILAMRRRSCLCSSKLVLVQAECAKCKEEAVQLKKREELAAYFKGIGVEDLEDNGLSTELMNLGVTVPKDLLELDQVSTLG